MVEKINALLDGIVLDYDRDVLPLSEAKEDGGVTERHLMYALAKKWPKRPERASRWSTISRPSA